MIKKIENTFRYASSLLRESKKEITRSKHWARIRDELVATVKKCEACGCTERLQVHHVQPFHLHPELELDPVNLIVLCMGPNECHLRLGHGGSFNAYNPNIVYDAMRFRSSSVESRTLIVEAAHRRRLV